MATDDEPLAAIRIEHRYDLLSDRDKYLVVVDRFILDRLFMARPWLLRQVSWAQSPGQILRALAEIAEAAQDASPLLLNHHDPWVLPQNDD